MELNKSKILIVEDEKDIRELMSFHLSKQNYEIDIAQDGRIAYDKLLKIKYNLLIIDWMIPEVNGLDLISWIRKKNHLQYKTPCMMVTAKSDPENIVLGLETGADDYMIKPFDFNVLRVRVQNLLSRDKKLAEDSQKNQTPSKLLSMGPISLNSDSHEASIDGKVMDLTYSEFRILEIFISQQGRVLSRKQITSFVQGEDVIVTGRTIDTHISSLRKKLGEQGKYIETIRGVGYRVSVK